jgi:hypothetical protein
VFGRSRRALSSLTALTLSSAILAACGGSGVTTTPVAAITPGTATSSVVTPASGGTVAVPPVSGITGTLALPPAVQSGSQTSATVTLSTTLPSGLPTPPLPALAYVTYLPSGQLYVPYYPQPNLTFPAGAVPAGAHVVYLYYRLGTIASQSHSREQRARAHAGEWLTGEQLAQSAAPGAFSTGGYEAAAPAAAGAGGAGAAGISAGTLAAIGAGVVAVAAIGAAVASSTNNEPVLSSQNLGVTAGASASITAMLPNSTTLTSLVRDCADVNGNPVAAAGIASVSPATATATANKPAAFTVSGVATGTCELALTANGYTADAVIVVGAGAPIVPPSPTPAPATPTPGPTATPTVAPTSTPTVAPTITPSPAATSASTSVPITTTAFGDFPVPALPGLAASSNISYPGNPAGSTGQSMFVTDSASNFASLPAIPNHTAILYITLATSSGGTLQFGMASGMTATLTGTLFTAGTQYSVAYTVNGTTTVQTVTASVPSNPSDAGAEIDALTPFNNLVLPADSIVGIVVAK